MNGDRTTLFLCGIIIAFTVALFHLFGVTDLGYDPATATRSLFIWVARRWEPYSYTQDDFPYGWAAPLVSLWMVWRLRNDLAAAAKRINYTGLTLIFLALALHWIGARTQQTRISFAAFLLLVWAIPFYLLGWRVARMLILPVAFLVFTMQLDFLSGLALKFRHMQAALAAGILDGSGIHVERTGLNLRVAGVSCGDGNSPGGLRSMMLIASVTVIAAWMRQRGPLRQLLLLSAVPAVVLISAALRLVIKGGLLSAGAASTPTAGEPWIDYVFYLAAFGLLFAWHRILRKPKLLPRLHHAPVEEG